MTHLDALSKASRNVLRMCLVAVICASNMAFLVQVYVYGMDANAAAWTAAPIPAILCVLAVAPRMIRRSQ